LFSKQRSGKNAKRAESPTSTQPPKPGVLAAMKKLKNPDLKFLEAEQYADMYSERMIALEKCNKRSLKKFSGILFLTNNGLLTAGRNDCNLRRAGSHIQCIFIARTPVSEIGACH
jgi:hypothetical protein